MFTGVYRYLKKYMKMNDMRFSRVLKKLREGGVVSCFKLNLPSGEAAEIAAMAGFDCIWLDREHVVQDWSEIKAQNWAVKAYGADTMVRVPRGSYSDLIKPLEINAEGLLVPHVMSLEDAKKIIHYTRFNPLGDSQLMGNADGGYTKLDFNIYLEQANERRFIALQIEDPNHLMS